MKITSVQIKNFKSIEDLTIDMQSYGSESQSSKTAIYVGINESGKSNILEAINAINGGLRAYDYESTYYKLGNKSIDPEISITYSFDFGDLSYLKSLFKNRVKIPTELLKQLEICSAKLKIGINAKERIELFAVEFSDTIRWQSYTYIKGIGVVRNQANTANVEVETHTILNRDPNSETILESIAGLQAMASRTTSGNGISLTKPVLEGLFVLLLKSSIKKLIPRVIFWKPTPDHLINNNVNLKEFEDDPDISIPLKNIFSINEIKTNEQISRSIQRALSSDEYKSELEDELSNVITTHIQSIWKEHKVSFKIKIDGEICKVHIEDDSTRHKYYKMSNRSDGFKQFVSLILSLSVQNKSDQLKDKIILLDEPEVHLHPSGIRYMRDEILRIGKNNHVFVSTHSHYFVDTNTPERHFIVEKDKKTTVTQLSVASNFANDEVVSKAFGLNLLKELLPQNVFLVEGQGDVTIFNAVFSHFLQKSNFTLRGAGGCSKVVNIAALLADNAIKTFIILDDDDEGVKARADILKSLRPIFNKNNVFTIKDILPEIPKGATLEDLYPIDFVQQFLLKRYEINFVNDSEKPFVIQLKILDKSFADRHGKDKLESLKMELSNAFVNEFKTKKMIQEKAVLFDQFCTNISEKIKILEQNMTDI